MGHIRTIADLKDAISELEFNKEVHRRMMKDSFNGTIESMKPGNIFKNIFSAIANPGLFANIIPAVVGIGAGFVSNRFTNVIVRGFAGKNRVRGILVSLALYGISRLLIKSPWADRLFGRRIVNSFFRK